MRRLVLSVVVFVNAVYAHAQNKLLTYDQAFRSVPTNINKPLPQVKGWADAEHFIQMQVDPKDGQSKWMSVDVRTNKSVPFKSNDVPEISPAKLGIDSAQNFTLSPDSKWAAYTKHNDLYAVELSSKKIIRLTNDGSDIILNGYASWLYYEEILGRASRYKAFWWSPDSKRLAYMRFDDSQVPVFPIYVADGQHGYLEQERYPKAGDKNPQVKIGIINIESPATVWADFNPSDDQYFGPPAWSPNGDFWIQWMNRGQDSLIIYKLDPATGAKNQVYAETQKTWIDLDDNNRFEFLPSGKGFMVKSDKDGWENLYLYDLNGKFVNQVTTGSFWGTNIHKIDEKAKQVYLTARKQNSARYDLYRVGLNGTGLTRLTFGEYSHDDIHLSPGGKYFITSYSNVNTPTTMALVDAKGRILRELGNIKGEQFANYRSPKTEIIRVKSADGLFDLPVSITYPIDFDPAKKYPVLVSIYGGPNAGTIYDRWKPVGGATQWWAQEGIIQVAFDNRSSGHFGKAGLNYIHRQLGKYEIEDYMTCGRWLKKQSFVDSGKIAITGGSFGGYMTCMALTYGADVFNYGIANASVTDWQLYDTHYTERYMDMPSENPEGYRNTAVVTYADKYRGLLRIVHGTTDDNVHMQNSLQLINRLEDLGKHFELMVYPNERHGIGSNVRMKANHYRNESLLFYYRYLLGKAAPGELETKSPSKGF